MALQGAPFGRLGLDLGPFGESIWGFRARLAMSMKNIFFELGNMYFKGPGCPQQAPKTGPKTARLLPCKGAPQSSLATHIMYKYRGSVVWLSKVNNLRGLVSLAIDLSVPHPTFRYAV